MDENHDGKISQLEFIEVRFFLKRNRTLKIEFLKACMAQKKFSTMLTLKIIDVFITDEQHVARKHSEKTK